MKPLPRAVERLKEKRQKDAAAALARRLVRIRDHFRCRCCGADWQPHNPVDVHHLKFRSAGGGDTTANMLLLCRSDHALVHSWRLMIVGDDANGVLKFERVDEESLSD